MSNQADQAAQVGVVVDPNAIPEKAKEETEPETPKPVASHFSESYAHTLLSILFALLSAS